MTQNGKRGQPEAAPFKAALLEANSRLIAVRALHHPSTDHGDGMKPYCVGCWEACGEEGAPTWPCPTIQALEPRGPAIRNGLEDWDRNPLADQ